ncbi:MAG: C_GCAxxG_C_C family protein [Nitrospiraceae bacterium]|nr:MAG: C_GCAxxG_C_C family protein [Nitrospiraceae bacterium]
MLAAYGDKLGIDHEFALRLANPFGGGIGKTGETCGAVIGALMVIGLRYGTSDPDDEMVNNRVYGLSRKFIEGFRSRNNSLTCRDLLGFDIYTHEKISPDKRRVIFDLCPKYIHDAAEILEGML